MWFLVSQMVHWKFQSWEPGHSGILTGLSIPSRFPYLIAWGFLQYPVVILEFDPSGRRGDTWPHIERVFSWFCHHMNKSVKTSTQGVGFFLFSIFRLLAVMDLRFQTKWSWSGLLSWVSADICSLRCPDLSCLPHHTPPQPFPPHVLPPPHSQFPAKSEDCEEAGFDEMG